MPAYRYECLLTGAPDGLDDLYISVTSLSYRQKTGETSRMEFSTPCYDLAEDIAARENGELVALWWYGDESGELGRTNYQKMTPYLGANNASLNFYGTRITTYTPSADVIEITGITYREQNQTDGKRIIRTPNLYPLFSVHAGDTLLCDTDLTIGELNYQISANSQICYITEA